MDMNIVYDHVVAYMMLNLSMKCSRPLEFVNNNLIYVNMQVGTQITIVGDDQNFDYTKMHTKSFRASQQICLIMGILSTVTRNS